MNKEFYDYLDIKGPLPSIAGTKSGALLIVGTASCVWDDLKFIKSKRFISDCMAVNTAAAYPDHIGRIDHIATLHPELLPFFTFPHKYRFHKSGIREPWTHSHRAINDLGQPILEPDFTWPLGNRGHCSGLLAIFVALLMGYEEIVLAGSPVDSSGNFYGPPYERTICGGEGLQKIWQEAGKYFGGRVTSLSGNTREWFGEPKL